MPEFPGGKEALIRFLQKNLQQPNDFEEGQKVTVIASFVVDKDGSITGINITQHGRNDLDNEVVRVIKKMPRWKPGLQNGRSVAVYYKVPVTFVSTE
jgi:protein TonB